MNMAEFGSKRSEKLQNVNFEPIIRRVKKGNFWLGPNVKSVSYIARFNCERQKWGKKLME